MQLREFCFNSCQRIPRSCWYIDQVKYSSFVAALFPFSSCHSCDLHSASLCLTPGSAQWSSMKSEDISSNCQQCYSTSHFPGMSPMLLLVYIIIWCVGIFATLGLSTFTTFQHSSGHLLLPYKWQDFVYIWSPLSIKNKLHTCVHISISVLVPGLWVKD
jgi:hypothetical protein